MPTEDSYGPFRRDAGLRRVSRVTWRIGLLAAGLAAVLAGAAARSVPGRATQQSTPSPATQASPSVTPDSQTETGSNYNDGSSYLQPPAESPRSYGGSGVVSGAS